MKPRKLTNEQIHGFCLALEHLLSAGISLGDALVLLAQDEQNPAFQALLREMADRADAGASLAEVTRQAAVFPAYVCTLLRVGETAGKTEQTLAALARYYAGRERMEQALRSALLYPAVLMLVLLAVAVILLVWVLPIFQEVYVQLGSSLTGLAGSLLAFGGLLRSSMPVLCGILAVAAVVLAIPSTRWRLVRLWNRVAGDRGVRRRILSARYVQALSVALTSGMTAPEAAALASALSEGEPAGFRERCQGCLGELDAGGSLSKALTAGGFLSASDRRLLDAGLRSGKSEQVLQQIAQRQLEQSEAALERKVSLAEPILIAVACALIGTVLLSVLLPLMQIMTAIG